MTPADRLRDLIAKWRDQHGLYPIKGCGSCADELEAALAASGHSLPPVVEPCDTGSNMATAALDLLKRAAESMEERAPDAKWWREYFLLTGQHMILTEHGWECGSVKDEYLKLDVEEGDEPGNSILDEVNAPSSDAVAGNEPSSQGLQKRCQERNAETGQCELRLGHEKHLAGYLMWAASGTVDAPRQCDQCGAYEESGSVHKGQCVACGAWLPERQPSPTVPEGEQRTIQEVLALHITSSESMREIFQRVGDKEGEAMHGGITEGLKRAIEVADNLATLRQPAAPSGGAAHTLSTKWRKLCVDDPDAAWDMTPEDCADELDEYRDGLQEACQAAIVEIERLQTGVTGSTTLHQLRAALAQESQTGAVTETKSHADTDMP